MQRSWREMALLLALYTYVTPLLAGRRSPCRWCHNVSHLWHGTAYKCGFCPRVPQGLPANLTWLNLVAFESTSLSRFAFHPYHQLQDVRLAGNALSVIPMATFKHLRHLRQVYLSENRLTTLPHLPQSVRVLHLQGNNITRLPTLRFPHLQNLVIDRNAIDKLEPRIFKYTLSLSLLSLADNKLELVDLENIIALEVLSLERNRLIQFPKLPFPVVGVYLDFNKITDLPELVLEELEELHLSHNDIAFISNTTFLYTPKLKVLDLSYNPLLVVPSDLLFSLNGGIQVDLTPIAQVIVPPVLKVPDNASNGYVWIVAIVSSFAFLSALMIALVVIVLTKTGCGSGDPMGPDEATDCRQPEAIGNSDEEKLVSTGKQA